MKKSGQYRVLKGASVYGPMSRVDMDRLLAAERVTQTDKVSFRNGAWQPIADFLEAERAAAQSAQADAQAAPAAPAPESMDAAARDGNLRVLKDNRIYGSLSRRQVSDLLSKGRITGDDLVGALDGPWMLIADFFAAPPVVAQPAVALEDELDPYEEVVESAEVIDGQDEDELEVIDPEAPPLEMTGEGVSGGAMSDGADAAAIRGLLDEPEPLSDHWYARIRGIHSAPLKRRHLYSLVQAKELTSECAVRHASWGQNDWRQIRSVPQLESILR